MPLVAFAAEQVANPELVGHTYFHLIEGYADMTTLWVKYIEVNGDNEEVSRLFILLRVADDLLIAAFGELDVPGTLECRILLTDTVYTTNNFTDTGSDIPVPMFDFVFLIVDVLFFCTMGLVDAELVDRPVYAIIRRHGSGQYEPHNMRIFTALGQVGRQDIGCIGPEVRTEVVAHIRFGQLCDIFFQLFPGVAPGEVGVRLIKARFGQSLHHPRTGKGFSQKQYFRMLFSDFGDHPFPETEGLGMRVIDPEDGHTGIDPVIDDAFKFRPQVLPVVRFKIKRKDIFVSLRW